MASIRQACPAKAACSRRAEGDFLSLCPDRLWVRTQFDPPNFLVLDEPTNHLDLAIKEMLITALSDFEGTMLFVSHDRHFLSVLSNRVLELTLEGIHQYGGGYTEYVARTGQERRGCAASTAPRPDANLQFKQRVARGRQ